MFEVGDALPDLHLADSIARPAKQASNNHSSLYGSITFCSVFIINSEPLHISWTVQTVLETVQDGMNMQQAKWIPLPCIHFFKDCVKSGLCCVAWGARDFRYFQTRHLSCRQSASLWIFTGSWMTCSLLSFPLFYT